MEPYEVEMELNLKTFIAETKEVVQALNKLIDDLEQIEKKYAESQEEDEELKAIRNDILS